MEFDRYFILSGKGIENLRRIRTFLDNEIGLEYEVDKDDDGNDKSGYGSVTIFSITEEEDEMLNEFLDKNGFQI